MYVEGNPANFTDPSGHIKCLDSKDPNCIRSAKQLFNRAKSLSASVEVGTTLPVEALAQLVDYAGILFVEKSGIMWGLTNVLIGIDPNKIEVWKLGLKDKYKIYPKSNPYFVGEDWLKYKLDPSKGARYSEIGDWLPKYWDETPNQAFHFWYYAAVEYYDNFGYASSANVVHDPYMFEWFCGEDLEKLKVFETKPGNITRYFNETSKEDYLLGLKGIEFGALMWKQQGRYAYFNPSYWIRAKLSNKNN